MATGVLCAPFFRSIMWMPDEGVLLLGARRLLQGERVYVDFFQFLPPGGFLITAGWFAVAGISFASARCLAILTIVGIACFTYLACRLVTKHAPSSALVAVAWVVMSQGVWTHINHHWLTTLFSMIAVWATLAGIDEPRSVLRGRLIAGLAAGAAAMITPTRGALVMLAALASFVSLRRLWASTAAYLCASLLVPAILIAYLVGEGSLEAAIRSVIVFPAERYATFQGVAYGAFADVRNLPLVVLFPLAACLAPLAILRDRRAGHHDPLLRPCIAFALAGTAGFLPRMDSIHIVFAAPMICPLFVYSVARLTHGWKLRYRATLAAVSIVLCVPSVAGFLALSAAVRDFEVVSTPRGDVTVSAELRGLQPLVRRIVETPPADGYFFYPFAPTLPFLTGRQHVAKYDVFIPPGYALPSHYQEACVSSIRRASWVVIDRRFTDPRYLKWVYPALPDLKPEEVIKFEQALDSEFAFVARDGAFEMRKRTETANEAVCREIAK